MLLSRSRVCNASYSSLAVPAGAFVASRTIHQPPSKPLTPSTTGNSLGAPKLQTAPQSRLTGQTKQRYDTLLSRLGREGQNADHLWSLYQEFCMAHGAHLLDVETHKFALRKCIPSLDRVKHLTSKRIRDGSYLSQPFPEEQRLQRIMRWIRSGGETPNLIDYHFVLQRFAVTGHLRGSKAVLAEVKQLGLQPDRRTYELCLKATSRRLSFPCDAETLQSLVREASDFCMEIMRSMGQDQTPPTSVAMDLCARILKETLDLDAVEQLLKGSYGLDLNFPDSPVQDSSLYFKTPVPFSTHVLNTTVEALGTHGRISRMIAAFETLTQPLPVSSSVPQHFDEEDEPGWLGRAGLPTAPQARPNTTTYNFLIKHCARTEKFHLVRHYILEALELDADFDKKLREDLSTKSPGDVARPTFSMNRQTLLPLVGMASRTKHLPLAQWVAGQCRLVLRRKRDALDHLLQVAKVRHRQSGSPKTFPIELPTNQRNPRAESGERSPSILGGFRMLDLKLQISILDRDVREIKALAWVAMNSTHRLKARIKERLRRRVWNGRDIFLVSTGDRTLQPRAAWRQITGREYMDPRRARRRKLKAAASSRFKKSSYFSPSFGKRRR